MTEPVELTNLIAWRSWLHGCDWGYRPIPVCGISTEMKVKEQDEFLVNVKENEPIIHIEVN